MHRTSTPQRRFALQSRAATAIVVLLAASALAGAAAAGAVAFPKVFWGVAPQNVPSAGDYARMRQIGVDTLRWTLYWPGIESNQGTYDWSGFDSVVRSAAQQRIRVHPVAYGTPKWLAGEDRVIPVENAQQRQAWADFLRAAAMRYGPGGQFWSENPSLPNLPMTVVQIWNEENFLFFAKPPISPAKYAELVKLSNQALAGVNPRIKLILGGLFAYPRQNPPNAMSGEAFMRRFYRVNGIKPAFEGVGIHPYARSARDLSIQMNRMRKTMNRAGDRRTGIWITEIGWGSGKGTRFEKGLKGQARELSRAFKNLVQNRRRWKIEQVIWFSWDDARGSCNFCDSTGLIRPNGSAKPAYGRYKAFAKRY